MKRLFLVLALFASLVSLGASPKRFADPAIAKAYDLFIPIACTDAEHFRFKIGTGFPVGKDLVMTAKHVSCDDGAVTEISSDRGRTWQRVPDEQQFQANDLDVQVFVVAGANYKHIASFRQAVIGERIAGYGIAFDETSTEGFVMKSDATGVFASNAAIGGMSGSAMVAADGKVVGMLIQGRPTVLGEDIASSWVSFGIPGLTLQRVVQVFQKGGRHEDTDR